jgi:hypothetical protein
MTARPHPAHAASIKDLSHEQLARLDTERRVAFGELFDASKK